MTDAENSALVFKDQAGGYFVLPLETLEQGRVPAAHTAEVERLVAEQADTQGHFWPAFLGLVLVGEAIAVGIGFSGGLGKGGAGGEYRGSRGPLRPL